MDETDPLWLFYKINHRGLTTFLAFLSDRLSYDDQYQMKQLLQTLFVWQLRLSKRRVDLYEAATNAVFWRHVGRPRTIPLSEWDAQAFQKSGKLFSTCRCRVTPTFDELINSNLLLKRAEMLDGHSGVIRFRDAIFAQIAVEIFQVDLALMGLQETFNVVRVFEVFDEIWRTCVALALQGATDDALLFSALFDLYQSGHFLIDIDDDQHPVFLVADS